MSEHRSEEPTAAPGPVQPIEEAGPRPRPTPTGRARRAAAAGVGAGVRAEVRRPSPSPRPTDRAVAPADPSLTKTAGKPDPTGPVSDRPRPGRRGRRSAVDTAPAAVATSRRPEAGRSPLWLALVLGGLVVIAAVALVVALAMPVKSGSASERDQALAAAKTEVPVILSYDYRTFDAGLAKGKTVLTGRMIDDYTKSMTTTIKPNAVKLKAVVQASTDSGGVESVSPDGKQVVVLVFGEQKVTQSSLNAPRVDLLRVRATLDLIGGHWLISKFDPL